MCSRGSKYTRNAFAVTFCSGPTAAAYSTPPDTLLDLRRPLGDEREGKNNPKINFWLWPYMHRQINADNMHNNREIKHIDVKKTYRYLGGHHVNFRRYHCCLSLT